MDRRARVVLELILCGALGLAVAVVACSMLEDAFAEPAPQ